MTYIDVYDYFNHVKVHIFQNPYYMFNTLRSKTIATAVVISITILGVFIFFQFNNSNNSEVLDVRESVTVQNPKVKIGYLNAAQALTTFVAQEKNYFKNQNLDVELIKFESPALIQDAIISGNIDMASTAGTGIAAIAFSKDQNQFRVFNTSYADQNYPSDVLVVGKDVQANSLTELKGKTVAILPGPQFKTIFNFMAKQASLSPSEVGGSGDIFYRELAIPEQLTALQSGQIQAVLGLDPVGTRAESLGAGKKIGISPISKALGFKFYGNVGLVNQKFATENRETTQKVINALDKAIDDVQKDPNAQRQYLDKYLGIKEPVLSKVALQAYQKSTEITDSDEQEIQKLVNIFQDQGVIKNKVEVKDMIYKTQS
jgi:NitT/TauT family transport system substrate-binding protein